MRSVPVARRFPVHVRLAVLASAVAWAVPDCPLLAADVLISTGDSWKFFRGKTAPSNPMTSWRDPAFNDVAWEEGITGIGYGDGDDQTDLGDMLNSYVAVFTRKAFQVADPAAITDLVLEIDYDDGFVAYLNGVEVARRNAGNPGDELAFNQPATALHEASAGVGGSPPERINLQAELPLLVAGKNVLAVEVRNISLTSTDLSFIPSLVANDATLTCPSSLACGFGNGAVTLAWVNNSPDYQEIEVLRDGAPIAGSPLPGDATTVQDAGAGDFDVLYEVVAVLDGTPCPPLSCTSTVQARGLGTLQCSLTLVNGLTQALLTWTNIPDTVKAEVRREGALRATLTGGEQEYLDDDVESEMPEDDTNFEVKLTDGNGRTATMTCGADLSLCPTVTCEVVDVAGTERVRLVIGNPVKEWETFTVSRAFQGQTVDLITDLPGTAAEYVDETAEAGLSYTYTLRPVAPPGRQAACDRTCAITIPLAEVAGYLAPAGGWDYSIDFEAAGTAFTSYQAATGVEGNLDGRWIRAVNLDFWDGSAPDEVGPAPEGPAPGGIEVVDLPGLGACGRDIRALRILDPGNPQNPAGTSLAAAYPDPFLDPSNKAIFLGLQSDVLDENLLRTGVTFAARWRVDPGAPAYLNAQATGDGQPLLNGALGNIGFHFLNQNGVLPSEGPTASLSFGLNSGDLLLFSGDDGLGGNLQLSSASITTFRSLWVTCEDPEGDGTYEVMIYTNGHTTPFAFGSGVGLTLKGTAFDFGSPVGNYLAIGLPDVGNDGVIEIDSIAYKAGVHPPSASSCSPVVNQPPHARIALTPASGRVTLSGGAAQATLDGRGSDDGNGGTQGLAFSWSKVSGPAGDAIQTPAAAVTTVTYRSPGDHVYRLVVNDRQPSSNTASAQATITVLPEPVGGKRFKRGDADGDGAINLTDPIFVLANQFQGGPAPACMDAADIDDQGDYNLTDAIFSLQWQFQAGETPPAPGPAQCGGDPTQDNFTSCDYPQCPTP